MISTSAMKTYSIVYSKSRVNKGGESRSGMGNAAGRVAGIGDHTPVEFASSAEIYGEEKLHTISTVCVCCHPIY